MARGLGLQAESVHALGRTGLSDPEQLRYAAREGYVFVTRNRDDYIRFTVEFFRKDEPHGGVLIVPRSLPSSRPERIAHALTRWAETKRNPPPELWPLHDRLPVTV